MSNLTVSDRALLERAVRNARPKEIGKHPRWSGVMNAFSVGSTTAFDLCKEFNLDPDEEIWGARCERCEKRELKSMKADVKHYRMAVSTFHLIDDSRLAEVASKAWRAAIEYRKAQAYYDNSTEWDDFE